MHRAATRGRQRGPDCINISLVMIYLGRIRVMNKQKKNSSVAAVAVAVAIAVAMVSLPSARYAGAARSISNTIVFARIRRRRWI